MMRVVNSEEMEPASPSSSNSSAYSPAFSSSEFTSLPIMSMRNKIVEKICENRVTLIIGETGCGKSSQVPQFLLEENMEPILCSQPRRFAVVAVAKMVARTRNCELGGEVGYHIGHVKRFSARSKIIFKTAGVLLEEMRDKGLDALKYKAIILDEVHERSVESDLVLLFLKHFLLKNNNLRVVLMSATADISRYRDYFRDIGRGERVEVLAIPSTNQRTIFQKRIFYLEQVVDSLELGYKSLLLDANSSTANTEIKPELHKIIHNLVLHIHEKEPDIEKSILVFLPTYSALEQQWQYLRPLYSIFRVHILHSSVDIEEALKAMKIWKSHRKVILATNIAESSVTIPKVAYVIDSCRSLQVFWDSKRKKESTELVWVSKSQAKQREGRTGRTCDGEVYRLVSGSFYNKLEEYESPVILRLSLRLQVLSICCAESKALNDPKALLSKALDAPKRQVVEDALSMLVQIHALEKTPRGRYEPTFYGRVLASLPLSFNASVLVIKFGEIGMLHEGILLGVLMDTQPLPIIQPFGEEQLVTQYIECYFGGGGKNRMLNGRKEVSLMANFSAFHFWQRIFMEEHRIEHLKKVLVIDDVEDSSTLLPMTEERWCAFHNLVPSSLHQVSIMCDDILNSMHCFRPKFMGIKSDGLPSYHGRYEFKHACILKFQPNGFTDALAENEDALKETRKCIASPYVCSSQFGANNVAEALAAYVKEINMLFAQDNSNQYCGRADGDGPVFGTGPSLCVYFMNGYCNRGSNCLYAHSLQAEKPQCKFFFTLQGCRNGESCSYSHVTELSSSPFTSNTCFQETDCPNATSLLSIFPTSPHGCILLVDDSDMHISSNLTCHYEPSKIICTTHLSEATIYDPSLAGVRIFWSLNHPYETIIGKAGSNRIPWHEVKCVLWFPDFDSYSENLDRQKHLLQNFFEYLAIRLLADVLVEVQVILTMNSIRFSRLQVETIARDCFFFLRESFPFDERSFGKIPDSVSSKRPVVVSRPISYIFDLLPPADIQSSDFAANLDKHLNHMKRNLSSIPSRSVSNNRS